MESMALSSREACARKGVRTGGVFEAAAKVRLEEERNLLTSAGIACKTHGVELQVSLQLDND